MDAISGILSLGGSLLNNLFAGNRQDQAQQFAAQQVAQQEGFQKEMRATAYQTATQDMKAAGLNPMMAAGINTSVPSGAAATGISAAPVSPIDVPAAYNAARQAGKFDKEMELLQAQIDNTQKDTRAKVSQGNRLDAETTDTLARIPGTGAESEIKKSATEQAKNAAITAIKERPYLESQISSVLAPTARAAQDVYKLIPSMRFGGTSARQSGWIGGNEVDTSNFNRRFEASFGR